ncbi:hypothetical protein TBLA_0C06070 [Henningerozyma blattae CBS 6284]|uniref:Proteasome chaperone 3 n=1 Tax=Henningerozyma blattae (strain ATCC 34711 / CBS 6284 / DSM 70876 / NBRC 10599 / NRRL Y-10934 / UCD 77-7) TaxID=1071380 RepID=I2H202_HENB6|nr:hypothetical protein TBLA_0C06070 [Tetrapisispora blattae CBS 6284]CCH60404.1 hypothetical protein TBLA_0C06070 [Tetrapisispora blattae CBS 6284]
MYQVETTVELPKELFPQKTDIRSSQLTIEAVHFINQVLIQIRYNGEMNTTYEISPKSMNTIKNPTMGFGNSVDYFQDDADESQQSFPNHLANYQITTRLGNSNDMKLPVICTEIAELYSKIILPSNVDELETIDSPLNRTFMITMSTKLWYDNVEESDITTNRDFQKLIFVLKTIREMYKI